MNSCTKLMNFTFENLKSYQYLHAQYISYMYM